VTIIAEKPCCAADALRRIRQINVNGIPTGITMLDESIPLTTNEYDEWGNPAEKEYYDYMLGYSPYDQISHQAYPAVFVGTGLWDSQVQYFEPAKYVAKLRDYKTDAKPAVFRINMEAGHGGKSGRFQRYKESAEQFAYMLEVLGVK